MICLFLLIVLLSVGAYTSPTGEPGGINPDILDEVNRVLLEGLLNDSNNLEMIKAAFKAQPGSVKICVPMTYNITCTNQSYCYDKVTEEFCTNSYTSSFIWTSFNTQSLSGYFLFFYASTNIDVVGFEWGGACDVYSSFLADIKPDPTLNLTISSLPCMDRDTYKYMNMTFFNLTKMVSLLIQWYSYIVNS